MKKNFLLGILLLVFSITLIGCTKESNNDQFNGTDIKEIGLKVEAKTIGSTGLTLVFEQYDSSLPKGELEFGEEYYIEKKNDEGEYSLIHTLGYIDYAWNEIAYIIKNGEITEHEVDWTWLYGNLPNGEYRLHKKIMDFIETGKFEVYDAYVYFTLENIPSSADEEGKVIGVMRPAVMVNDVIYYDTGIKDTTFGRCGMMDGNIDSMCKVNEMPTKNGQSNFGKDLGYQYGPVEGTIEVQMDGNFYIFEAENIEEENRPMQVIAKVKEIGNGSMIVTPIEGSKELKSSDEFIIPVANMNPSPEPVVGDELIIAYYGGILETYPAQLGTIICTSLVERGK